MLNLETHILLFALDGSLTPAQRSLLAGDPWGISVIVLESARLAQLGRIATWQSAGKRQNWTSQAIPRIN
jgi:hypothetical protein